MSVAQFIKLFGEIGINKFALGELPNKRKSYEYEKEIF